MKKSGDAFTLIEMLVVVAIIGILMGLLFPAFSYSRQVARKTKAKSEVKQLDIAWKSVLSDYRRWVDSGIGEAPGGVPMDKTLVDYLSGANDKGTVYMEFEGSSTNAVGAMVDPWYHAARNPNGIYQVALGPSIVTPPHGVVSRSVVAWSRGPDGLSATAPQQKDDIKSWE